MKAPLAALCALCLASFAQAGITVTGTGKVKYTPDVAYLSVGVSTEDRNAAPPSGRPSTKPRSG